MDAKVIHTEQQYKIYIEEIQKLISSFPKLGSPESDKLELFSILIEAYENKNYPIEALDPVEAILFRMHEKGLKQIDLVPYFGTKSRVSEILGRKRPLTVPMIRALNIGLGISTDTLVGLSTDERQKSNSEIDWSKFPIKEMVARGWINKADNKKSRTFEDNLHDFISQLGWSFGDAAFKRTLSGDAYSPTTKYALQAWLTRVVLTARERKPRLGGFDHNVLSNSFLRELVQLSWFEQGPLLGVEFLEKHGIAVVIEPHLKGTMLDGAALKDGDGTPIVALTLRYDRLDNFWFTLVHEVVHLWKHVGENHAFLDDLDSSSEDQREAEANRITRDTFIPRAIWRRSDAYLSPSKDTIEKLSRDLKISPSIIAGRIRRESNNYQQFTDMIGQGAVKHLFSTETT